jgi:hypothetical protein
MNMDDQFMWEQRNSCREGYEPSLSCSECSGKKSRITPARHDHAQLSEDDDEEVSATTPPSMEFDRIPAFCVHLE